MKRALLLSFAVLIVAATLLSGCATKKQVVTVATDATWPPFESVNEQTKELEGYDIDLMNAIAKEAGLEIQWVNVPFDSVLAGLGSGQYDVGISVISILPERAENMLFSDPYYDAGQLIAVRIDNTDINKPEDLAGKLVGGQISTTGIMEVEKIQGAEAKTYDSIDQAFLDLMNGQIDAVVADAPLVEGYVAKHADKIKWVGKPFTDEKYGIAVKKGSEDLLTKINTALQKLKDQGYLEQLHDKWIKGQ